MARTRHLSGPTRVCGILCAFASRQLIPQWFTLYATDSPLCRSEWHVFRNGLRDGCTLPVEGMGVSAGSHETRMLGIPGDVAGDAEPAGSPGAT